MLTPEYLSRVAEGAEDIASQLHTDIINRITSRVLHRTARGDDYILTATDKWNIQTLQEAGYLLEDIQKEIIKATQKQEEEIKSAMEEAGVEALRYDDMIYRAAGLSPVVLTQSPHLVRLMQHSYEATIGEWKNFTRTTATEAQNLFIRNCDKAYHAVTSGALSYNQAIREAVEDTVNHGVGVKYPSGHTDTIETATARAVRTGISQATGAIQIARMEEMDWDIILVSSHLGARNVGDVPENHELWQGKFYSRTGKDKRFPLFRETTGFGKMLGLGGINCRHSFGSGDGVNNPFGQYDTEENRRAYELSQRQRELERRIRKTKQAVSGMQTAVDNATDEKLKFELQQELDRKAALLKRQNADYRQFCKDNSLKPLQERLRIAKWDREAAKRARIDAKRHNDALEIRSRSGIIKLPKASEAVIPKAKFTEYALDPVRQPDKARAFKSALGYTRANADELIAQIRANASKYYAKPKGSKGYGERYEIIMEIKGSNGKTAKVATGWIADNASKETRLTSAYVPNPRRKVSVKIGN